MLARLFKKARPAHTEAAEATGGSALHKMRAGYADWRFQRDIAAIMASLDRLSDRRLALIGVRRDALFDAVSDLMLRAADDRAIADEVIAMLERAPAAQKPREDIATPASDAARVAA
ncbi:hypothetical protein DKT77_18205 [Meridianimarinicoccus roseus]|jgi:hypothetical protein|uniref:Uncharacterized protein n=1 Tax=Meridianimarinicoccus roseus TaxID=2072018 RepID=A0A2V2L6P6_9RHOB|nr:hypothetical protein [Meridianimarinicoccus roseus]PWR01098.1 hypothetical protein DKT77_18205 [Meridianimarinicoccus roseus]